MISFVYQVIFTVQGSARDIFEQLYGYLSMDRAQNHHHRDDHQIRLLRRIPHLDIFLEIAVNETDKGHWLIGE